MTKPQVPVGLPTSKSAHPLRQELDSISLENVARSPGFTDSDFDNESCSVIFLEPSLEKFQLIVIIFTLSIKVPCFIQSLKQSTHFDFVGWEPPSEIKYLRALKDFLVGRLLNREKIS
ncbi:hypothetical protein RRG08_036147 [Elysia crispata]|uniref:Uncharacterized protein n=1 Tax=Elysia crispata TaxID=231223 RepID=A0AAE1AJL0_9GAST|nr:hypothetical protein RRG08_036147 [Elysia crispata]